MKVMLLLQASSHWPLLYWFWLVEYCQNSPNRNKSQNILVCCIFGYSASLVSITLLSSTYLETWKKNQYSATEVQKYIKHEKMFSYPLTKRNSGCNLHIYIHFGVLITKKSSKKWGYVKVQECHSPWISIWMTKIQWFHI